jgi:hypothetical protein
LKINPSILRNLAERLGREEGGTMEKSRKKEKAPTFKKTLAKLQDF